MNKVAMESLARATHHIRLLDRNVIQQASRLRHPVMDFAMRAFTRAGDWQTWTILLVSGLAAGGTPRTIALRVIPRIIPTFLFCRLIKGISKRPRPTQSIDGFSALLTDPDPYSFPSSHAACAWSACLTIGFSMGGGWALLIPYATLISYSRIHVGAHYPLDVLIGTGIGITAAVI